MHTALNLINIKLPKRRAPISPMCYRGSLMLRHPIKHGVAILHTSRRKAAGYLAAVMGLLARQIVGWALSHTEVPTSFFHREDYHSIVSRNCKFI